jgi:hypothetical protein
MPLIEGGSSTTKSRTCKLFFNLQTTLNSVKVPIELSTSTSSSKKAVVTVSWTDSESNSQSVSQTGSYEKTETGDRIVEVSIGQVINGEVSIKYSGTNATIDYGTYSYPIGYAGEVTVTSNAFHMTVDYNYDKKWQKSNDNDGYPWIGNPPDETVFNGYDDPKPKNSWKSNGNNGGYVWTWGFDELSQSENIFLKTSETLVSLTSYYKDSTGLIPISFVKQM